MAPTETPTKQPPPKPALSEPARRAWEALFVTHRRAVREAGRQLAEAGLPPLQWYDALYMLYLAPERQLTQHQLSERILISPSGTSRLVDRMAERGLVKRCDRPGDRRSLFVRLTEEGIELMREMWLIYGGVIAEFFAPAIAGREEPIAGGLEAAAEAFERACPTWAGSKPPAQSE